MPIEFAPPSPSLQGFNVPPPQSTDPLQTLAQMGQLRTQGLQQQTAGMQLDIERQKLDSNKALLDAMVAGGGDPEKTFAYAAKSGKVLPADLISMREHHVKMQQDAATLDKTTRENTATDIDRYRGLLAGVQSPDDLAEANAKAEQLGIGRNIPRHMQFSDPAHVQAFSNSLAAQAQVLKEATERATREREEAATKLAGVQTTEAEQKVAAADRAAAIAEIQAASDASGVPNPADWAVIQQRHPKTQLPPGRPTPETIAAFVRSGVAPEKQPEYDLNAMKAKLGLMGNSEFDQYQLRYAQSLKKKPNELSFPEFQTMLQSYAKDKQDPGLLAAILGLKGAQQTVAQAQVASILTPEQIQSNARDLLNGDLAPDQIKELRPGGRINQGPQIIEAARAMAKEDGRPFSLFDLEQQAAQRENTLKEFTNTTIGHAGGQKLALNTLIHHADLYLEAAQALKNGNFRPGNALYNKIATMFGSAPPTNAALLAQFFASETGKVATGGVPAEGEIKSILSKMGTDGSPDAMEGAGRTLIGIAAGRMIPLKDLRDKAKLQKYVDILGPDAREVLQRRGYNPESMKPWKVGDTVYYQGQTHKVKAINPTTGKLTLD